MCTNKKASCARVWRCLFPSPSTTSPLYHTSPVVSQVFRNAGDAYILAFAIIMLNTDAHNPMAERRLTNADFILMNQTQVDGGDFEPVCGRWGDVWQVHCIHAVLHYLLPCCIAALYTCYAALLNTITRFLLDNPSILALACLLIQASMQSTSTHAHKLPLPKHTHPYPPSPPPNTHTLNPPQHTHTHTPSIPPPPPHTDPSRSRAAGNF